MMDQNNVRRIGDVTIQRLTPLEDVSDEVNINPLSQSQLNLNSSSLSSSVPQLSGLSNVNSAIEQSHNPTDSKPESQDDDSEDEYSDSDDDYNGDDDDDELGFESEMSTRKKLDISEPGKTDENKYKTSNLSSSFHTSRANHHEHDNIELKGSSNPINEINEVNSSTVLDRRKFSNYGSDSSNLKFPNQENDFICSQSYSSVNDINEESFNNYKNSGHSDDAIAHIEETVCSELPSIQQYNMAANDGYQADGKNGFYHPCTSQSQDFNNEKTGSREDIENKDEYSDNFMEQENYYEKEVENDTMETDDYKHNLIDIDGYPTEIPDENLPQELNNEQVLYNKDVDDQGEEITIKEESIDDFEDSDGMDTEKEGEQVEHIPRKKNKRKIRNEITEVHKNDESGNEEDQGVSENKKCKTSDEKSTEGNEDDKDQSAAELKLGALRRNIREVMDETKLEEATLAAQRQEMERLRRVQEQQKVIRDVQKQIVASRQNSKVQARVMSLLQGGSTSLVKRATTDVETSTSLDEKKSNTVLVKLSTGSGPPQIMNKKMLDMLKNQKNKVDNEDDSPNDNRFANLSKNLNKPQMMTASVSIAPIKPGQKKEVESSDAPSPNLDPKKTAKPKGKDVVMISSSSGEEDDCIVISEGEEESEAEEDTSNSGMHTNDLYNVPDEQGRVLINVGHPESEQDVFLSPQISRMIKPHQIGGVRFLYDNIVESLDRYKTSDGFGCILAHSMGLGKTLQVISFCDVFLRYTDGRRVLCIMPINTLQNWVAEFNMWLPIDPEQSPLKEQGEVVPRNFPLFVLNDSQKTLSARASVIQNWHKEGGVLLIGYELYRQLSLKKPPKSRKGSKRKTEQEEEIDDEKNKTLLEEIHEALVKPGPDLVICDEGHRIKNSHASISQALKQIRSKRRVVLTGYPLQNNLLEYWCMVDFVRPNYLGTKTEFSNMFERPIQNGQCIDSTPQDIRLMRYRAHVLHSLLEGFVQRRSHAVLQQTLPRKYEFVLLLRLTPFQRLLYNTFMNEVVRTKAVPNPLKAFAVCCKIWNHPDILYNFLKKRADDEELDLDLEETSTSIGTPASGPSTPMTPTTPPQYPPLKRGRNSRSVKGSQFKDVKSIRKNSKTETSSINKSPMVATVMPNTANIVKSESPLEQPSASQMSQFDSYSSQFSGNVYSGNDKYGNYNHTTDETSGFNNQYTNASDFNNQQNIQSSSFSNESYYQQQQQAHPQQLQHQTHSQQLQQQTHSQQLQQQTHSQQLQQQTHSQPLQQQTHSQPLQQQQSQQQGQQQQQHNYTGENYYRTNNNEGYASGNYWQQHNQNQSVNYYGNNSSSAVSNSNYYQSSTSVPSSDQYNNQQGSQYGNSINSVTGTTGNLFSSQSAYNSNNYDFNQTLSGTANATTGMPYANDNFLVKKEQSSTTDVGGGNSNDNFTTTMGNYNLNSNVSSTGPITSTDTSNVISNLEPTYRGNDSSSSNTEIKQNVNLSSMTHQNITGVGDIMTGLGNSLINQRMMQQNIASQNFSNNQTMTSQSGFGSSESFINPSVQPESSNNLTRFPSGMNQMHPQQQQQQQQQQQRQQQRGLIDSNQNYQPLTSHQNFAASQIQNMQSSQNLFTPGLPGGAKNYKNVLQQKKTSNNSRNKIGNNFTPGLPGGAPPVGNTSHNNSANNPITGQDQNGDRLFLTSNNTSSYTHNQDLLNSAQLNSGFLDVLRGDMWNHVPDTQNFMTRLPEPSYGMYSTQSSLIEQQNQSFLSSMQQTSGISASSTPLLGNENNTFSGLSTTGNNGSNTIGSNYTNQPQSTSISGSTAATGSVTEHNIFGLDTFGQNYSSDMTVDPSQTANQTSFMGLLVGGNESVDISSSDINSSMDNSIMKPNDNFSALQNNMNLNYQHQSLNIEPNYSNPNVGFIQNAVAPPSANINANNNNNNSNSNNLNTADSMNLIQDQLMRLSQSSTGVPPEISSVTNNSSTVGNNIKIEPGVQQTSAINTAATNKETQSLQQSLPSPTANNPINRLPSIDFFHSNQTNTFAPPSQISSDAAHTNFSNSYYTSGSHNVLKSGQSNNQSWSNFGNNGNYHSQNFNQISNVRHQKSTQNMNENNQTVVSVNNTQSISIKTESISDITDDSNNGSKTNELTFSETDNFYNSGDKISPTGISGSNVNNQITSSSDSVVKSSKESPNEFKEPFGNIEKNTNYNNSISRSPASSQQQTTSNMFLKDFHKVKSCRQTQSSLYSSVSKHQQHQDNIIDNNSSEPKALNKSITTGNSNMYHMNVVETDLKSRQLSSNYNVGTNTAVVTINSNNQMFDQKDGNKNFSPSAVVSTISPLNSEGKDDKTMSTSRPQSRNESFSDVKIDVSKGPMKSDFGTQVSTVNDGNKIENMTDTTLLDDDLEEGEIRMPAPDMSNINTNQKVKEEPGIPYDWAVELYKDYEPGHLDASAKMLVLFCMLEEIVLVGDRLLLFSQSLFTLDLIEQFLHLHTIPNTDEKWMRNRNYFRLDGSTSALEREKLINEFNGNTNIYLFLVSTRAGSLGINLVGANRVIVFDASWNPCHDTQAVCRVYRYGQQKSCYVYRFVMDNCLERKIYDRQINKQGMSDRVVDESNPAAYLTIKDVSSLCWDNDEDNENNDFSETINKFSDIVIQKVIEQYGSHFSKEPFQHESLLIDHKDKKLSQAEKRMAKRSYELEKQANTRNVYGYYGNNNQHGLQIRTGKPMASVRPMQAENQYPKDGIRKWIPAEVWQKQGMSAQEMTLPLDVVIPTNTGDSRSSIVLRAGQKVMVLKSPKGIYMQLENGKIIAIKTAMKTNPLGNKTVGKPNIMNPIGPRFNRPQDKNIASLGHRRDITLAPVRNRFTNTRANAPGLSITSLRQPVARLARFPQQPMRTQFSSMPRPSPRFTRVVSTSTQSSLPNNKQIFGPNSPVTITLANKRKSEAVGNKNIVSNAQETSSISSGNNSMTSSVKTAATTPGLCDKPPSKLSSMFGTSINASTMTTIITASNTSTTVTTNVNTNCRTSTVTSSLSNDSTITSETFPIEKKITSNFEKRIDKHSQSDGLQDDAAASLPSNNKFDDKNLFTKNISGGRSAMVRPPNGGDNINSAKLSQILPESFKHKKDINLTPIKLSPGSSSSAVTTLSNHQSPSIGNKDYTKTPSAYSIPDVLKTRKDINLTPVNSQSSCSPSKSFIGISSSFDNHSQKSYPCSSSDNSSIMRQAYNTIDSTFTQPSQQQSPQQKLQQNINDTLSKQQSQNENYPINSNNSQMGYLQNPQQQSFPFQSQQALAHHPQQKSCNTISDYGKTKKDINKQLRAASSGRKSSNVSQSQSKSSAAEIIRPTPITPEVLRSKKKDANTSLMSDKEVVNHPVPIGSSKSTSHSISIFPVNKSSHQQQQQQQQRNNLSSASSSSSSSVNTIDYQQQHPPYRQNHSEQSSGGGGNFFPPYSTSGGGTYRTGGADVSLYTSPYDMYKQPTGLTSPSGNIAAPGFNSNSVGGMSSFSNATANNATPSFNPTGTGSLSFSTTDQYGMSPTGNAYHGNIGNYNSSPTSVTPSLYSENLNLTGRQTSSTIYGLYPPQQQQQQQQQQSYNNNSFYHHHPASSSSSYSAPSVSTTSGLKPNTLLQSSVEPPPPPQPPPQTQ